MEAEKSRERMKEENYILDSDKAKEARKKYFRRYDKYYYSYV
jgi:hypothetical protein